MSRIQRFSTFLRCSCLSAALLLFPAAETLAGGGLVLQDDVCIIQIDFYSAHFTAYQPATSGNKQFCRDLPDTGPTIFVLDYLHQSLKEVPVEFRIIRDVTGQGRFVKLKHIEELGDIAPYTVFHQLPVVRPDASFKVEYDFKQKGAYVAIVSAGHPSNGVIYTAVFPFQVGASSSHFWIVLPVLSAAAALFFVRRLRRSARKAVHQEAALREVAP